MADKKKYTGVVIKAFKTKKKLYPIGAKWDTTHEGSYNHLINTKRIK